jgi:hypothetical protein
VEGGEHSPCFACKVLTRDFEGGSANAGGTLLRRRYVSGISIIFDFPGKVSLRGEFFSMQWKNSLNTEKKLPSGRKAVNNPSFAGF